MNIQTILLPKVAVTSVRANGFSSTQFKAATWRGDDLLVQMKNGEVLVLKGANAKRLSTPEFFLVFDDTSLPLASFAPGMDQPVANKAPHVPPFEVAAPVKVGKLPQGSKKAKGAASADDNPADEAWADQALAITNAGANTAAPDASVSTSSVPLVDNASTASAASTTDTSATTSTTASWGSSLWGWPAVALGAGAVALSHSSSSSDTAAPAPANTVSGVITLGPVVKGNDLLVKVYDAQGHLLGADIARADGSFTVTLDKKPVNGVIRVNVTAASDTGEDYVGENGQPMVFTGALNAVSTLGNGPVNINHATDLVARKLVSNTDPAASPTSVTIAATPEQVKAVSAAVAKALVGADAPVETLTPKPTVDAAGKPAPGADLLGQLLKAVFEQVNNAAPATATAAEKAAAANAVLSNLAASIDVPLPAAGSTNAPVATIKATDAAAPAGTASLGEAVLAAKVADYATAVSVAAAVAANPASTPAAKAAAVAAIEAKTPSVADFQAAGIPVTTPEAAKAVSAAAAAAVNTPTPAGSSAPSLVDTVANAATEAVAAQNSAPTAVTLTTALTGNNIAEVPNSGSTTARTKVADMAATDDGLGTNTYTLGGADAAKFEVDGNALYLKSGTALDFETKASYTVTVAAQDSSVAGSAATPAVTYTLNVTNVNEAPTANGTVDAVTATAGTAMSEINLSGKFIDVDASDTRTYALKDGSTLPAGLVLDATSGKITGTPTATTTGAQSVTVVATDAGGLKAEQTLSITVEAADARDTTAPAFTDGATKSVGVAENATVVYTAAATDNRAVTAYALAGGADAALFDINTTTGALTFKAGANYEAPGSAAGSNAYIVKVKASDAAGNEAIQTLTVNVTNVNEAPTANGTVDAVTAVTGTAIAGIDLSTKFADVDAGDTRTYALKDGSTLPAGLALDAATGHITGTPTATTTGAQSITVVATDAGGLKAEQTLAITVNAAPDTTPPTFAEATKSVDVAENATVVYTAAATDNRAVTAYALAGGADAALFDINTTTGALTFKAGANYEAPGSAAGSNAYTVKVKASDAAHNEAVQTVTVNVTNVNEAPTANGTVDAVTAVKDTAIADIDLSTKFADVDAGDTRTYTLKDGSSLPAGLALDAATGHITGTPTATTTGAQSVTVVATDAGGLKAEQTLSITVEAAPVPDAEAPVFAEATKSVDVAENATVVYTAAATDNRAVTAYALAGGADAALFDINTTTGALTFKAGANYEAPGSAAGSNAYTVKVKASDAAHNEAVQTVTVNVTNVNEAPTANGTVDAVTAVKDTAITDIDLSTKFADVDAGDTRTYALKDGSTLPAGLVLDAASGKITGTPTALTTGAQSITVVATDAGGLKAEQTFTVTVNLPADTTLPVFAEATKSVDVAENATATGYTAAATDDRAVTAYAFDGGADDGLFNIDASTGALTFKAGANYEAPGSAAGSNAYTVKVKASDAAGNSATQTVTVNVTNVNEAPTANGTVDAVTAVKDTAITDIDLSTKFADVDAGDTRTYALKDGSTLPAGLVLDAASGKITGTPTALTTGAQSITVVATDAGGLKAEQTFTVTVNLPADTTLPVFAEATKSVDVAENATATGYTAAATDDRAVTAYAFDGGADDGLFNIDASTGALTFKAGANYEAPGSAAGSNAYTVKVKASDAAGNSATQTVTVNVTNVNEAPTANGTVDAVTAVKDTAITDIDLSTKFADVDAGDTRTYALKDGSTLPAGLVLDAASGKITGTPTALTTGAQSITVVATDAGGLKAEQTFTVTVNLPADTTLPVFAEATKSVDVAENATATGYTAAATDDRAVTAYAFDGGADDGLFNIDASTGALTFKAGANYEAPGSAAGSNAYTVKVKASDAAGNSATQTVTVNVTNVNEAPTANGTVDAVTAVKDTAITDIDLSGKFADVDAGDTRTYALKDGSTLPAGLVLDAASGKITGTPTALTTGAQSITVVATDAGGLKAEQTFTVTVNDASDTTPPAFAEATKSVDVAENATVVYTAAATDAVGVTGYAFGGGADDGLFNIDAITGALTFKAGANYEAPGSAAGSNAYTVKVKASDAAGNSATQTVTVNVTNVNEAPTANGTVDAVTATKGTAIADIDLSTKFADVDAGDTRTYTLKDGSSLPAGLALDAATGHITGTPTATTSGATHITVVATDAGGLKAEQTLAITVNDAVVTPLTFTSSLADTVAGTHLDVRSDLVLTASENVTAVAGKFLHITWDSFTSGSTGYAGQATGNSFDIAVDSPLVSITGNKITINPSADFDLDFSSNYHITIDSGAFTGASGGTNAAVTTGLSLATVTPGDAAGSGGLAAAVDSVMMADGADALLGSYKWLNLVNVGDFSAGSPAATYNLDAAKYALVGGADIDPLGPVVLSDGTIENIHHGVDSTYYVKLTNFLDDMFYLDDPRTDVANKTLIDQLTPPNTTDDTTATEPDKVPQGIELQIGGNNSAGGGLIIYFKNPVDPVNGAPYELPALQELTNKNFLVIG